MKTIILLVLITATIIFYGCTKTLIKPEDPNTGIVWLVGDRTAMKSINAGIDWVDYSKINDGVLYQGIQGNRVFRNISFYRTTYGLVTSAGYIAMSMNSQNWGGGGFNSGTYYSCVRVDSIVAYACGMGLYSGDVQKIIYTFNDDGSATWVSESLSEKFPYPRPAELYSIDFISPSDGWVVGQRNYIFHTTNGGMNWTRYNITPATPNRSYRAVRVHYLSNTSREVWVAGNNGAIYKAPNDVTVGTAWTSLNSGTTQSLNSMCFTDNGTAYFAGSGGVIIKTSDNGINFKTLVTGTTETLNSISFMDDNYGFAVGNKGTFLKTTDAGETWSQISSDVSKNLYCVSFLKRYSDRFKF